MALVKSSNGKRRSDSLGDSDQVKQSRTGAFQLVSGEKHPMEGIIKQFRSSTLCDVVLIVNDDSSSFRAHKVVLAGASDYFMSLFVGAGAAMQQQPSVRLEMDKQVLALVLDFIYYGECKVKDTSQLVALVEAACFLQMQPLLTACGSAVESTLLGEGGVDSSVGAWQLATELAPEGSLGSVGETAYDLMARRFEELVASDSWLEAPRALVRALLGEDRLQVSGEKGVCRALLVWLRAQAPPLDADETAGLLALVRFPLLTDDAFKQSLRDDPVFNSRPCSKVLLDGTVDYGGGGTVAVHARQGRGGKLYAVGGHYETILSSVERFDPVAGKWEAVAPMGSRRAGLGVAVLEGKLYAVGGHDGSSHLSSVERFDPVAGKWEAVAPMGSCRGYLGVAVLEGKLYAVGGYYRSTFLSSVERFDPVTGKWEAVAPMGSRRYTPGVAVLEGKLYAVGGYDGSTFLSSVERFDPVAGKWEAVAPMGSRRYTLGVAVLEGKLYAVGGYDGMSHYLSSVERFDPVAGKWEAVAPMGSRRAGLGVAVLEGKLYAVCGYDGSTFLSSVERFDPVAGKWEAVASMGSLRNYPSAAVLQH